MKCINLHIGPIHQKPLLLLKFGLPFISAGLIYTALYLNGAESGDYYIIIDSAKQMLEHLMMSLALLVGGTLLFDYVCRKK